jgi:hypothetical protein
LMQVTNHTKTVLGPHSDDDDDAGLNENKDSGSLTLLLTQTPTRSPTPFTQVSIKKPSLYIPVCHHPPLSIPINPSFALLIFPRMIHCPMNPHLEINHSISMYQCSTLSHLISFQSCVAYLFLVFYIYTLPCLNRMCQSSPLWLWLAQ